MFIVRLISLSSCFVLCCARFIDWLIDWLIERQKNGTISTQWSIFSLKTIIMNLQPRVYCAWLFIVLYSPLPSLVMIKKVNSTCITVSEWWMLKWPRLHCESLWICPQITRLLTANKSSDCIRQLASSSGSRCTTRPAVSHEEERSQKANNERVFHTAYSQPRAILNWPWDNLALWSHCTSTSFELNVQ